MPRYLTKSRFKLALECPTKLFYTHKAEYANTKIEDSFLESLAQGGFQVEELARMYFPDGIAILGDDRDYQGLLDRTNELLQLENVIIFEAAFLYNELFIRVDILKKTGAKVELIEVKAKSISPTNHNGFFNGNGIVPKWVPYLYDIAFQQYVIKKSFPEWSVKPFLMLANKDAVSTVNGLNQNFRITKEANNRTGVKKKDGLKLEDLGERLLAQISVEEEVLIIQNSNPVDEKQTFEQLIEHFIIHYKKDQKIVTPIGRQCKDCEFKTNEGDTLNSGFHECWNHQLQISIEEINRAKVYDVWDLKRAKSIMKNGRYFMQELIENDIDFKVEAGKLSKGERQWLQIEKVINNDSTPHFEIEGLRDEIEQWQFPLNFIDFETSSVALPFTKRRKPYEQIAFQFSHHIMYENGRVEHIAEYLNASPGTFPNFEFIRALKETLEKNKGTIFRYHNHENTVLNKIFEQLFVSNEPDRNDLMEFIKSISHSTKESVHSWKGKRDMVDLHQVVLKYYYDPATKGSNSIKDVLPAVLNSSAFLKNKYANPIGDLKLTSTNYPSDHVFLQIQNGIPVNPYKLLPPLFEGWTEKALADRFTEIEEIADGGAALTAYAKLQFEEINAQERKSIESGLLKYCELDTLAMVMIYEYFRNVIEQVT